MARRKCDTAHSATSGQANGTKNTSSGRRLDEPEHREGELCHRSQISRKARATGIRAARSAGSRPPTAPISAAKTQAAGEQRRA